MEKRGRERGEGGRRGWQREWEGEGENKWDKRRCGKYYVDLKSKWVSYLIDKREIRVKE